MGKLGRDSDLSVNPEVHGLVLIVAPAAVDAARLHDQLESLGFAAPGRSVVVSSMLDGVDGVTALLSGTGASSAELDLDAFDALLMVAEDVLRKARRRYHGMRARSDAARLVMTLQDELPIVFFNTPLL